jgi:hypothetical protein
MGEFEAEVAKDVCYKFEAKKDGFSQLQSGASKVTLTIQPDDLPMELIRDQMGQRYMCVIVPLNDDETPKVPDRKSYAGQAKMMAKDEIARGFLASAKNYSNDYTTEEMIKHYCGIQSCSELIEGTDAGKKFKRLQAQFLEWKNG